MRPGFYPFLALAATLSVMAAQAEPPKPVPTSAPSGAKTSLVYVPAVADGPKTRVTGLAQAAVLLKAGIWFDGLAVLMTEIESRKDDEELIAARDTLLQQVGLTQITSRATKADVAPAKGTLNVHP